MNLDKTYHRLKKRIVHQICSKLYIDSNRNIDNSILIAGTGRSGTTWLADIISSQVPTRTMFEPFHSRLVARFKQFEYHQYMRPAEHDQDLMVYCHAVLSGKLRHRWIDREVSHIFPKYRVIKEIRANLFLKWFNNNYSNVPILFIIRHPCAVVLSNIQLSWPAGQDINSFLSQEKLIADFLRDKLDIIQAAETLEEKIAVIWCVTNMVPLRQFCDSELNIFFYEHLCTQPEIEIPRIFRTARQEYDESVFKSAGNPSTTTRLSSAVMTGSNRVTDWKRKLSPAQVDRILSIVRAFGLNCYYDESVMPVNSSVSKCHWRW